MSDLIGIFDRAREIFAVPENIACADWCDKHYKLPAESSNTFGNWQTTPVQLAILNAIGNDAIEKVDFFKSARFGGTKMLVGGMAYLTAHKKRNIALFQPTKSDSNQFVKNEINPAIRDCDIWHSKLLSDGERSPLNTLDMKAFVGCNAYFNGGHSANSFRRLTLDAVFLDELDGFNADVESEGDPTTLSWGRVKNSLFKKQVQISTPTLTDFSLIQKSAKVAEDALVFQACCPRCKQHAPISWGGKDVPWGFKWSARQANTVTHICSLCGEGWANSEMQEAVQLGYWRGEKGWSTRDGLAWSHNGKPAYAPRHIAFKAWSAYSPFSSWSQIVEEWYDAFGDFGKMQTFTNTTLGETWSLNKEGTVTSDLIDSFIPIDLLDNVVAVTAGVDIQDDRIEVMFMGHEHYGGMVVLDYHIFRGDMSQADIYKDMAQEILSARFQCGNREMPVIAAAIDTQGHHTANVHRFLQANKRSSIFVGINGTANNFEIADKPGASKGNRDWVFYSIGSNVLKQKIFSAIRNYDQERGAFKIYAGARLPEDFSKQLTAEKMEVRRVDGRDLITFTNNKKARNEALDCAVYNLAAKAYIKQHRGRNGKMLFMD